MFEDYFKPDKEYLLETLGKPIAVIIETPYEWKWAKESVKMPFSAEDFIFGWKFDEEKRDIEVENYDYRLVGNYGNDYYYYGLWLKKQ